VPSSPASTLPSLASSALRIAYLNYSDSSYDYLKLTTTTTANTTANFLSLNNDINNDNINLIDFIYGIYITNDIINHDYNAFTPGYIGIGNKGYHLTSGLCSSQTICITTDPTMEDIRVYHVLAIFDSLIL
jgi:hypothetical protein